VAAIAGSGACMEARGDAQPLFVFAHLGGWQHPAAASCQPNEGVRPRAD